MARMQGDDPPYLEVGTEVSAKYRGAFCEAKVRKVVKQVKAKVNLKFNMGTVVVSDEHVKGRLHVGANVEVKHPDKGQYFEGVVAKIFDTSQYTVVFDDGDITTLRRTSLCLKSGRHFTEAESLDHLPLTHPEHFSNPVRQRRRGNASQSDDSSESESDSDVGGSPTKRAARKTADWMLMVGKVVSVEVDTNKKKKDNWFPALVVAPTAQIDARRDFLVRSFQDGRYYTVPKKETSSFQRDFVPKNNNSLKTAIDKAVHYLDRDELPPHWDRDALFGTNDSETNTTASDSESSDEESREEKDHFVAQLYKFMDDRGTPINRAPTVGARDLDLHRLWKVVQRQGGYNKVTNQNVWKTVGTRLTQDVSSPVNTNSVKVAYKRYLLHFEEFQRKLGCTLVSHTRGTKVRSSSGRSLIRERDRTASSGSPAPLAAASPAAPPPPPPPPAGGRAASAARERDRASASPAPAAPPPPPPPPLPPPVALVKEEAPTPATPAPKSATPAPKSATPAPKSATPAPKSATPAPKSATPAPKSATPAPKSATPAPKSATPAPKSATPAPKSATPAPKSATPAPKSATPAPKSRKKQAVATPATPAVGEAERKRAASLERRGTAKKNDVKDVKDVKKEPLEEVLVKTEDKEAETKSLRTRNKESESVSSASPAPSDKSDRASGSSTASTTAAPAPATAAAAAAAAAKTPRERRPSFRDTKGSPTPAAAAATCGPESASERRRSGPVKRRKDESPDDDERHREERRKAIRHMTEHIERLRAARSPETLPIYVDVQVGDKVSVLYKINSKKERTIYEAKVLQVDPASLLRRYYIHYLNWNKRYDEWVKRNRIIENLSWAPTRARRNSRVETKPAVAGSVPSPSGTRRGRSPVVQSVAPASAAAGGTAAAAAAAATTATAAAAATAATAAPPAPSAPSTRSSTPASDVARSPASAAGRVAVRQSAERERKTAPRKGTPALSDSEPEPAEGADDGAPPRRRLARQRSSVGRADADDDGKATPPRRGSRRVRKRDSETPAKSASSSSETRGEEDSRASAERTEPGGTDEGDTPKPRQAEADSTSDALDAAAASAASSAGARSSVSDIYEFTDECEDGFPARDASSKLKSVINTYGARTSRSPGAAESPPAAAAPTPAPVAAPASSPAPVAASPSSPAPSPSKKRKLAEDDASSPMSTPTKAARRTPTRRAPGQTPSPRRAPGQTASPRRAPGQTASPRRAPGQTASPRRPAKKRGASASPSPASRVVPLPAAAGVVVTPKLTVTKLTEFQLSRVTLVKASSVQPVPLPPPPRLQPAPQVLPAAEYKATPLPAAAAALASATLAGPAVVPAAASEPTKPQPVRVETVLTPGKAPPPALGRPAPVAVAVALAVVRPPSAPPAAIAAPAVAATAAAAATVQKPTLSTPYLVPAPSSVPAPAPGLAPAPAPAPTAAPAQTPKPVAAQTPKPASAQPPKPVFVQTKPVSAPAPTPAPTPVPVPALAPNKLLPSTSAPPSAPATPPPPPSAAAAPSVASVSDSPGGREPQARWRHEPDSERRVAALSSPVKASAGSGCDLTCRETIPGSPERVEGPGRPASAPDRMEMPFASLPSGVRPAPETERVRREGHDEPLRPKMEPERVRREEPERPRPKVDAERGVRPKVEAERVRPKAEPERPRPNIEPEGARPKVEPEGARPKVEPERPRPNIEPEGARPKVEPERPRPNIEAEGARPKVEPERPRPNIEPEGARPKVMPERPRPNIEPEGARPKVEPERPRPNIEPEGARPKVMPERVRPKPELESARREEAERVMREGAEARREEADKRAELERARREEAAAAPLTPDSPDGSDLSSKRGSAEGSPDGRSTGSSEGEASPAAASTPAAADSARPPTSRSAGSPSPGVNGLVASLAPASLPAGRGLRQRPPTPAPAEDDEPAAKRRRTRRRRRRISVRSGKGVSDSDDLNDRSNGDQGEAEPDARRPDKPYKYNFMPTFDDDADRETRIQVLTDQIDKLRDRYSTVKGELGRVHRRIKKLKKKHRDLPVPPSESVKKLRPSFVTP